jgi:hypothetical protein
MGSNGGELTGQNPYFTAFYVFDVAGFRRIWCSVVVPVAVGFGCAQPTRFLGWGHGGDDGDDSQNERLRQRPNGSRDRILGAPDVDSRERLASAIFH